MLGRPPGAASGAIGYLPQRRSFAAGTRLRGVDLVRLGLDGDRWGLPLALPRGWGGATGRAAEAHRRVAEVIELVGAAGYAERPIGELSGGEQQRLLIAQALVRRPGCCCWTSRWTAWTCPTRPGRRRSSPRSAAGQGVATLLVAHDVNPLLAYLDRVVYLAAGQAVEGSVEEVVNTRTLTRLYGVAVEVLRASDGRLVVVGQPEPPAHHHDRHGDDAHAASHDRWPTHACRLTLHTQPSPGTSLTTSRRCSNTTSWSTRYSPAAWSP